MSFPRPAGLGHYFMYSLKYETYTCSKYHSRVH